MGAIQTIRSTVNGLDELADVIANPDAGGPVRQAIGNTGRAVCNAYSRVELAAPLLIGPAKTAIDLVCKPYFDGAGITPPAEEPPYAGGQCPVAYTVWFTLNGQDLQIGGQTPRDLIGPLGGVTRIDTVIGSPFPDSTRVQFFFSGPQDGVEATFRTSFGDTPSFRIAGRVDGQPDSCGDPPGELQPGPTPGPSPGPFPPGEEPGVDPDNQPFFFVPDIQPPGSDPLPLPDEPLGDAPIAAPSNPAGGDGLPGDPDAVGGEAGEVTGGADGEEIDFGPPPAGKIWVGCIVETVTDTRIGNIPGTGPQSTVWPSVRGNVALRYGSLFGKSERINSKFFDIFRPNTSLTVTGCFLQVQPGSTSKVFPISAITCPVNPCES